MVLPLHAQLIGADLHRPFHFEGGDPGAVGAGAFWLDTTVTPHRLWRRNGSNTAWVAVAPGDPEAIRDEIGAALVAGPGVAVSVNDPGDTITVEAMVRFFAHQQAAGTNASSSNGSTWLTWLTTTRVVPAGNWAAVVKFDGLELVTVATGGSDVRVGAPFVGAVLSQPGLSVNTNNPASLADEGSFGSDGTTPTEFRVEYRRNDAAGAAATITARGAGMSINCRRTG